MRRIILLLSTLVITGALASLAVAQSPSVFRYASDPFSEDTDEATDASAETEDADSEESSADKESYDSYASWPNGGKNLVQQKAMYRAQQREIRIAARQWYGYSAARPPVYGNPYYMDAYAPSLWSQPAYTQQSLTGPFGWYFPRRSLSAHRWSPYTYAATILR